MIRTRRRENRSNRSSYAKDSDVLVNRRKTVRKSGPISETESNRGPILFQFFFFFFFYVKDPTRALVFRPQLPPADPAASTPWRARRRPPPATPPPPAIAAS